MKMLRNRDGVTEQKITVRRQTFSEHLMLLCEQKSVLHITHCNKGRTKFTNCPTYLVVISSTGVML